MATWPTTLPQSFLLDSYAESEQDGRIRTAMDAGPDFVRRRYSAVSVGYSGSMILSAGQVAILRAFYADTLSGGVATFAWHPLGRHNDSPQVILTMRFLSPPSYRAISQTLFQVDMAMEALP